MVERRSSPADRFRENATEVTSMLVTGIWVGALLAGFDWWLGALLFGYIAVVPIVETLYGDEDDEQASEESRDSLPADEPTSEDALETLRDRYARGELTDEQFERKLDRLLATETIEDAEDRRERERERARE